MAYSLHIERESSEITFTEWVEAVLRTRGANLEGKPTVGKNPRTGDVITVGGNPNNVSVHFPESEDWQTCIFFSDGKASFNGSLDMIENENDPVRLVAKSIASLTGSKIVGDEGEFYNW
jgi:hypothetical protein